VKKFVAAVAKRLLAPKAVSNTPKKRHSLLGADWHIDNVLSEKICPSGWAPGTTNAFNYDVNFRVDGSSISAVNGGVIVGSNDHTGQSRMTQYHINGDLPNVIPVFPGFDGKVYTSTADDNADGFTDIWYSAGARGGPVVGRMDGYKYAHGLPGAFQQWYGIEDPGFRGGARVAVSVINGRAYVIVGAGDEGGPRVAVYEYANGSLSKICADFFMFESALRDGVNPFIIVREGRLVIAAGAAKGGAPRVVGFDLGELQQGRQTMVVNFFAGDNAWRDGVKVAFFADEIYAAPIGSDTVDVFDLNGNLRRSFRTGVLIDSIGVGDVNGDNAIDLAAEGTGIAFVAFSDPQINAVPVVPPVVPPVAPPVAPPVVPPAAPPVTPTPDPKVSIQVTTPSPSVAYGGIVSFAFNYANTGTVVAHGVVVDVAFTAPLSLNTALTPAGFQVVSSGLLHWTIGDLQVGQAGSVIGVFNTSDPGNPFLMPPLDVQVVADLITRGAALPSNTSTATVHLT
jgi:hypothetical protein